MAIKTKPFDVAEYLHDPASQTELLANALETGNSANIIHALGVVARARGMSSIVKEADVSSEVLHKALSEGGDLKLSTLIETLRALGLKLSAKPAAAKHVR